MATFSDQLRELADSQVLLEIGRKEIENALVESRDGGFSVLGRNNGFVIKSRDGSNSDLIRFGPETGLKIALKAIADYLDHLEKIVSDDVARRATSDEDFHNGLLAAAYIDQLTNGEIS